ncbi:MAG: hypothetical protein KatS3mg060_3460 [Dehalococcoidia bacterium]|nr:MAG: hypothetical protein KatS3mg060_3460 [Dehalococcoidia bacterium]
MDLSHVIADEYREQAIGQLVAAPLTALRGVTPEAAERLREAFKIDTVGALGRNILFRFAEAMAVMGSVKNDAVHPDWGEEPLRDVLDRPPTVVKYVTPEQASALESSLGITTLREMGTNPIFLRAQALLVLAAE